MRAGLTTGLVGSSRRVRFPGVGPGAAMLALLAATASLAQPSASGDREIVVVEGLAPAEQTNRLAAARLDAMRKVIEQVAGRQVRTLALTSYHQLVANYTLAQANGFVESAEALGPGEEVGGVFRQRFRIAARSGAINRDLVAQRIDVDFLYEIVARPRIALAVRDEWRLPGQAAGWEPDGRALSNQEIARFFKARHPGFVFQDLELMRDSRQQAVDYVREANRARFEILVVGTTRAVVRAGEEPGRGNDWEAKRGDLRARGRRFASDVEIEWRAINVATAETLFTVTGRFATPEHEAVAERQAPDAAVVWAKERLLAGKVPELFRELLAHWNRSAWDRSVELIFRGAAEADPDRLLRTLIGQAGYAPETVRLVSARAGEIVFGASPPEGVSDQAGVLRAAFAPGFFVQEIRPGRIVLAASASARAELRLEVAGLGLAGAVKLQETLAAAPGVAAVRRLEFSGGRVAWGIATDRTTEEVALLVEQAGIERLRVTAMGAARIEAIVAEGRP